MTHELDLPPGELHLGAENPSWLKGVDLVVTSPGIPRDSILLLEASIAAYPVIGELELASRFISAPIVGSPGPTARAR